MGLSLSHPAPYLGAKTAYLHLTQRCLVKRWPPENLARFAAESAKLAPGFEHGIYQTVE